MKIRIRAIANAKVEKIKKINNNEYVVMVKEPAIKGRANKVIVETLAEYFKVFPSQIRIAVGHTSKNKIIEIT